MTYITAVYELGIWGCLVVVLLSISLLLRALSTNTRQLLIKAETEIIFVRFARKRSFLSTPTDGKGDGNLREKQIYFSRTQKLI